MELGGTEDFGKAEAVPQSPAAGLNSLGRWKRLERARLCVTWSVPLLLGGLILILERDGKAKQPLLTISSTACSVASAAFSAFLWMVPQTNLLCPLPLTADPNVCNNIGEQLQKILEQSIRPSGREAE